MSNLVIAFLPGQSANETGDHTALHGQLHNEKISLTQSRYTDQLFGAFPKVAFDDAPIVPLRSTSLPGPWNRNNDEVSAATA
jgi:hypothetical protein